MKKLDKARVANPRQQANLEEQDEDLKVQETY